MAIALLRASYHSRKAGHSAVRGAAYRSGQRLVDERTGEVCDWSHRTDDVLFEKLFTRDHAPDDLRTSRAALWNAVEAAENRGDARIAYEIKLALPHELSLEENIAVASAYANALMQRHGQAVDLTIHKPDEHGDTRNIHAHLMLSPRSLEADGFAKKKLRDITDKVKGPQEVEAWRQTWQNLANQALERAGHERRIDMRSYKRQGIEREGEIHLGPAAAAMERRGVRTEKGDINRAIKERNQDRQQAKVIDLAIEREKRRQEQKRREDLARKYDDTIAREQQDLQAEQRQDRERLQRQQQQRRQQDEQRQAARFRTGFLGWWDKLTGRQAATEHRNAQEREEQRRQEEADQQRLTERQAQALKQQEAHHARLRQEQREILEHGEPERLQREFNRESGRQQVPADRPPQEAAQEMPVWMDDSKMAEAWKKELSERDHAPQPQHEQGRGRSLGHER